MNIVYLSSEVVPFAKTGGLADVAGALPVCLKAEGHDVLVITPLYRATQQKAIDIEPVGSPYSLQLGGTLFTGAFYRTLLKQAVPAYFVGCDALYDRPGLYGDSAGDYPDNAERYIFFCRAALELCRRIGFVPDIVHCNDWQTGLIPAYLRSGLGSGFFDGSATIFTIHNLAYQGLFPWDKFALTGLPHWFYDMNGMEFWGMMSMLKSGIAFSRAVTTVSPKYAAEIQAEEHGCGLEGMLQARSRDLYGVLNGADYDAWDPSVDPHILSRYSARSLSRKRHCKKDLLREAGLPAELLDAPLIGSISRMVDQKGFDLIAAALERIIGLGAGYVLLGSGDRAYERVFRELAASHPHRVSVQLKYDDVLAHKIEAGCDIFLMPSRYEPCGLNQIYSLKYGTVPLVRATGGLDDTIADPDEAGPADATGFKFTDYSADALVKAAQRAIAAYAQPDHWRRLMRNGMACDFSWKRSAREYLDLYRAALAQPASTA